MMGLVLNSSHLRFIFVSSSCSLSIFALIVTLFSFEWLALLIVCETTTLVERMAVITISRGTNGYALFANFLLTSTQGNLIKLWWSVLVEELSIWWFRKALPIFTSLLWFIANWISIAACRKYHVVGGGLFKFKSLMLFIFLLLWAIFVSHILSFIILEGTFVMRRFLGELCVTLIKYLLTKKKWNLYWKFLLIIMRYT